MQPMKHKLIKAIRQMAIASIYAGGLIAAHSVIPAQAQDTFDDAGIQFDVDTVVEFEFAESHGADLSTFGVINLDTQEKIPLIAEVRPSDSDDLVVNKQTDFLGTPGNAVPQPLAEFNFKAKTRYAFYLESSYKGKSVGIVYSANLPNLGNNSLQARFDGNLSALASGGSVIRWNDNGTLKVGKDRDFNDFVVRAGGHKACPFNNVTSKPQDAKVSYQAKSLSCQN
jgi:hypothetical protein